jgi:hypothetical protein
MKTLLLLAALSATPNCAAIAADVPSADAALTAYAAQDFGKCAAIMDEVIKSPEGQQAGMPLFYVECLSASGKVDVALSYLDAELPKGKVDLEDLKHKDRTGLNKLRATLGWSSMLAKAESLYAAREAKIDRPLRAELLKRVEQDQAVRQQAIAAGNTDEAWKLAIPVDQDNTKWLKQIVAQKGWPTKSLVGDQASNAAFLIAQHSPDEAFQEQVLVLMEAHLKQNEVNGYDIAMLRDRTLMHRGSPQIYGTQFDREPDGAMVMYKTEDLEGLDTRRAQMGLPSIAEYKKALAEMYHARVR